MKKRIVVALGGNALGNSLTEQKLAVKSTAAAIVDLVQGGDEVVIVHGNGPQVGMINLAMDYAAKADASMEQIPLDVNVAMSQGYIGFDLQAALSAELEGRGIQMPVVALISQTLVDKNDPAFQSPTKPIGAFLTKEEADKLAAQGVAVVEDAGRGWRRVVASPRPVDIIEKNSVKALVEAGQLPIAAGGGGIPVVRENGKLQGIPAVVDKDFASCRLAIEIDADYLIILTAVEKVAINFGKPDEQWLSALSIQQAEEYIAQGHFAPGSMLPKVQAAMEFASSKPGRRTLITLLQKARDGIDGKTGTVVVNER